MDQSSPTARAHTPHLIRTPPLGMVHRDGSDENCWDSGHIRPPDLSEIHAWLSESLPLVKEKMSLLGEPRANLVEFARVVLGSANSIESMKRLWMVKKLFEEADILGTGEVTWEDVSSVLYTQENDEDKAEGCDMPMLSRKFRQTNLSFVVGTVAPSIVPWPRNVRVYDRCYADTVLINGNDLYFYDKNNLSVRTAMNLSGINAQCVFRGNLVTAHKDGSIVIQNDPSNSPLKFDSAYTSSLSPTNSPSSPTDFVTGDANANDVPRKTATGKTKFNQAKGDSFANTIEAVMAATHQKSVTHCNNVYVSKDVVGIVLDATVTCLTSTDEGIVCGTSQGFVIFIKILCRKNFAVGVEVTDKLKLHSAEIMCIKSFRNVVVCGSMDKSASVIETNKVNGKRSSYKLEGITSTVLSVHMDYGIIMTGENNGTVNLYMPPNTSPICTRAGRRPVTGVFLYKQVDRLEEEAQTTMNEHRKLVAAKALNKLQSTESTGKGQDGTVAKIGGKKSNELALDSPKVASSSDVRQTTDDNLFGRTTGGGGTVRSEHLDTLRDLDKIIDSVLDTAKQQGGDATSGKGSGAERTPKTGEREENKVDKGLVDGKIVCITVDENCGMIVWCAITGRIIQAMKENIRNGKVIATAFDKNKHDGARLFILSRRLQCYRIREPNKFIPRFDSTTLIRWFSKGRKLVVFREGSAQIFSLRDTRVLGTSSDMDNAPSQGLYRSDTSGAFPSFDNTLLAAHRSESLVHLLSNNDSLGTLDTIAPLGVCCDGLTSSKIFQLVAERHLDLFEDIDMDSMGKLFICIVVTYEEEQQLRATGISEQSATNTPMQSGSSTPHTQSARHKQSYLNQTARLLLGHTDKEGLLTDAEVSVHNTTRGNEKHFVKCILFSRPLLGWLFIGTRAYISRFSKQKKKGGNEELEVEVSLLSDLEERITFVHKLDDLGMVLVGHSDSIVAYTSEGVKVARIHMTTHIVTLSISKSHIVLLAKKGYIIILSSLSLRVLFVLKLGCLDQSSDGGNKTTRNGCEVTPTLAFDDTGQNFTIIVTLGNEVHQISVNEVIYEYHLKRAKRPSPQVYHCLCRNSRIENRSHQSYNGRNFSISVELYNYIWADLPSSVDWRNPSTVMFCALKKCLEAGSVPSVKQYQPETIRTDIGSFDVIREPGELEDTFNDVPIIKTVVHSETNITVPETCVPVLQVISVPEKNIFICRTPKCLFVIRCGEEPPSFVDAELEENLKMFAIKRADYEGMVRRHVEMTSRHGGGQYVGYNGDDAGMERHHEKELLSGRFTSKGRNTARDHKDVQNRLITVDAWRNPDNLYQLRDVDIPFFSFDSHTITRSDFTLNPISDIGLSSPGLPSDSKKQWLTPIKSFMGTKRARSVLSATSHPHMGESLKAWHLTQTQGNTPSMAQEPQNDRGAKHTKRAKRFSLPLI